MLRETVDRRYDSAVSASPDFPPLSESLQDCQARLMPFLEEELRPAMEQAIARARAADETGSEYEVPTVVVVASDNVLRGLVMHLEGLTQTEVPLVDIPYAVPLIYQLDSSLAPIQTPWAERPLKAGWYLGDPAKVRAVQAEIKADLPDAGDEDACFMTFDGDSSETQWKC